MSALLPSSPGGGPGDGAAVAPDAGTIDAWRSVLGSLAPGVAHELNNPLTYVLLDLSFLAREAERLAAEHPALAERLQKMHRRADEARAGADKIARMVHDLRWVARAAEDEATPADLRVALDSAIALCAGTLKHRARVVKSAPATPVFVADGGRAARLLVALLAAAAQALPEPQPGVGSPPPLIVTLAAGDGRAQVWLDAAPPLRALLVTEATRLGGTLANDGAATTLTLPLS